jgi:hypothetical protein
MGESCRTHGGQQKWIQEMEKLDGRSQLEIPRRRWEDDIKTDLLEMVWGGTDRNDVPQDRDRWWALLNEEMNIRIL